MTPRERAKLNAIQRQLVGETQLADKLYAALVQGGFDNMWWAMQDYCQARGRKGKQPPKFKNARIIRRDNEFKIEGWRTVNCEPFYPKIDPEHPSNHDEEDDSQ